MMRKFKNRKIIVVLFMITINIFSCQNKKETLLISAKDHADKVINNLTEREVIDLFNADYFGDTISGRKIFEDLNNRCDIKNGKGGYIGHFTEINNEQNNNDKVHLLYEFTYDCGDIRFLFSYNIYNVESYFELFHFKIERSGSDNDIVNLIKRKIKPTK